MSQIFVNNLLMNIKKELSDILAGEPHLLPFGSNIDLWKGLGDDLKTKFIPFRKSEYQAHEHLYGRIPVRDENLSFFDFVTPIVNVKGKSVQGISTLVTYVGHPIPETYVLRMVGLKYNLFPHEWVVNQEIKPKEILKNQWIDSQAINEVNKDKNLCNTLFGNDGCKVEEGGLSNKFFKIKMNPWQYPPGMFTAVPYKGHTFLVAKEAGKYPAKVDKPYYPFAERFKALSGVAKYISWYPDDGGDEGEWVGEFYVDPAMEIALLPLKQYIDQQVGY